MPSLSINTNFIKSPYGVLHYHKYGDGEKILLVFHGFGQDHEIAIPIAKTLQSKCTIYSFDLPYHGRSIWNESEEILTKKNIQEIFETWFQEKGINDFSTFGYSMGGKFALNLAESFPQKINQLVLIAPDGLYKSIWYRVLTVFPLRSLFKHVIYHPALFFGLTKLATKMNVIPTKLIKFAESQMQTLELRKQVYYTWINFKKLYTKKYTLINLVTIREVKIHLILGEKDSVVKLKNITPFVSRIDKVNLTILPIGHSRLVRESIPLLKQYF